MTLPFDSPSASARFPASSQAGVQNPNPGGVIAEARGEKGLSGACLEETQFPGLKVGSFVAGTWLETLWSPCRRGSRAESRQLAWEGNIHRLGLGMGTMSLLDLTASILFLLLMNISRREGAD